MRLGVHASIAGGVSRAVSRAVRLGCNCVQLFCHSPRTWDVGPVEDREVEVFRAERKNAGLWPVVVHTSYLINLSSPDNDLYRRSVELFSMELETAGVLGADYLVVHPGSFLHGTIDSGIERVVDAIKAARRRQGGRRGRSAAVEILIENTAGGGSQTGGSLEDIGRIIKGAAGLKVGLCFDTCHGFASGYSMDNTCEADLLVRRMDKEIGLERLRLIHLNDSKGTLGSRLDRHAHIGMGRIGTEGLRAFINHPKIKDIPLILETPKKSERDDPENLERVREMRRNG